MDFLDRIAFALPSPNPTHPDIDLFKDEKRINLDLLIMSSLSSSIHPSKDLRRRASPLQNRRHLAAGWTSRSTKR
jgi:hypothetical protein